MQKDNSSYTVTSPDMMLTDDGVSVLITSTSTKFIDNIKDIYEKWIDTSIVFSVQKSPTSESSIGWMWYVSQPVDMMIVDLDTCAWVDVCAALLKKQDDNHTVVFISLKNKKREALRLLNAASKFIILPDLANFEQYLKIQLGLT